MLRSRSRLSPALPFSLGILLAASMLGIAGCRPETPAPTPAQPEGLHAAMSTNASARPAPSPLPPPIEIVESFPAETTLDHADVPDTAEVWLDMIRGAKKTLDIAHFYVSNASGHKLEPVLIAIEEAAARGVHVRLLVDLMFYERYPESVDRLGRSPGIIVRKLDLKAHDGVQHAKYFIVDGQEVFLGSQNMDWRALEHIQEIGARLRVPEVAATFTRVFEYDWVSVKGAVAIASGASGAVSAAPPIRVLLGQDEVRILPAASPKGLLPRGVTWDLPELIARIDGAKRSIDVQLLTYHTKTRNGAIFLDLDDALRRAAKRGIRVRLLVADWSKRASTLESLKKLSQVEGISIRFLVIPQSSSGFIPFARVAHAKYMVVDGTISWIGTSNWEGDYFTASRNVGIFAFGAALASRLGRIFEDGFESAYAEPLDPTRTYEPPRTE